MMFAAESTQKRFATEFVDDSTHADTHAGTIHQSSKHGKHPEAVRPRIDTQETLSLAVRHRLETHETLS